MSSSSWYSTEGSPCIYPFSVTDVTQSKTVSFLPNIPAKKGPTEAEGVKKIYHIMMIFSLLSRIPSWPPMWLVPYPSIHPYFTYSWVPSVPHPWEWDTVHLWYLCVTVHTGRVLPFSDLNIFLLINFLPILSPTHQTPIHLPTLDFPPLGTDSKYGEITCLIPYFRKGGNFPCLQKNLRKNTPPPPFNRVFLHLEQLPSHKRGFRWSPSHCLFESLPPKCFI